MSISTKLLATPGWGELKYHLQQATQFEITNELAKKNETITEPKNIWLPILKYKNIAQQEFCLLYKTPFKGEDEKSIGELALTRVTGKCEFTSVKNSLVHISNIHYLKVTMKAPTIIFDYEAGLDKTRPEKLSVTFNRLQPNYTGYKNKKLADGFFPAALEGVILLPEPLKFVRAKPMEITSKINLDKAEFCEKYNTACGAIISQCETCEGFTEVVGGDCWGKYDKICSRFECGQKGLPACPKQAQMTNKTLRKCSELKQLGTCSNGAAPECEGGYLVCE
ncbi:MAG: hypothetical protein JNM93_00805 [Bacteriovoracaceae bacterium]|nr:hypothetical protein [Bacteriovoracaceae bacterium]